MRWYKFSIVLVISLLIELIVAIASSELIKANGEWLSTLSLPTFAPKSALFYGMLMELVYLSSATAVAFYVQGKSELPKALILNITEGGMQILTLIFFFSLTYEITSFFFATATMILSLFITSVFMKKSDAAGIIRLPALSIELYLWMTIYCILMTNFT